MADYHPLIARAVQGLPDPAPEMRAAVYDRARTALFAQLRSLDPPLSEAEFESERDALETAIASVEAAYSGAARPDESGEVSPAQAEPEGPEHAPEGEPVPDAADSAPDNGVQAADAPPPGLAPTGTYHPAYQEPEHQELPPYRGTDTAVEASPEVTGPAMTPPETRQSPAAAFAARRFSPAANRQIGEKLGRASIRCLQRTAPAGGMRAAIVAASLVAVIGVIAFVAYWLSRDTSQEIATAPPVIETPDRGAAEERIEERLGETPAIPGEERVEPEEPVAEPPAAPPEAPEGWRGTACDPL